MLDFHRGECTLIEPIEHVVNELDKGLNAFGIDFYCRRPGHYISSQLYENTFKLTLKSPYFLKVENSLHKYLEGGTNVFDLNYTDMVEGLHQLYTGLGVDLSSIRIYRPELECSIQVDDPFSLIQSIMCYQNKPMLQYNDRGAIIGKWIKSQHFRLKYYSKYLEMKQYPANKEFFSLESNLEYLKRNLRTEFVIMKSAYLKRSSPLSLEDFENKNFLKGIYIDFHNKCNRLMFHNSVCNKSQFAESQILSTALFSHPNQFLSQNMKEANPSKFQYLKRVYNNLLSPKMAKEMFLDSLREKTNILFN